MIKSIKIQIQSHVVQGKQTKSKKGFKVRCPLCRQTHTYMYGYGHSLNNQKKTYTLACENNNELGYALVLMRVLR